MEGYLSYFYFYIISIYYFFMNFYSSTIEYIKGDYKEIVIEDIKINSIRTIKPINKEEINNDYFLEMIKKLHPGQKTHVIVDINNVESINQPIFLDYTLLNTVYSICIKEPLVYLSKGSGNVMDMILGAYLVKSSSKEFVNESDSFTNSFEIIRDEVDITTIMKQYQGPEFNFYNNLNGVSYSFKELIDEYFKRNNLEISLKEYSLKVITLMNEKVYDDLENLDLRRLVEEAF